MKGTIAVVVALMVLLALSGADPTGRTVEGLDSPVASPVATAYIAPGVRMYTFMNDQNLRCSVVVAELDGAYAPDVAITCK